MSGALTHAPAKVLRQLLVDLSLGTLPEDSGSWPINYGNEPNTPDNTITVTGTEGVKDGRAMKGGRVLEHYGAQVRVRGADEQTAHAKANAIDVALAESVAYTGVTISGSGYTVYTVTRISGPISLGKELSSKRNIFTINVTMAIRQTA